MSSGSEASQAAPDLSASPVEVEGDGVYDAGVPSKLFLNFLPFVKEGLHRLPQIRGRLLRVPLGNDVAPLDTLDELVQRRDRPRVMCLGLFQDVRRWPRVFGLGVWLHVV